MNTEPTFKAWIDVGGTFTDCFVVDSAGNKIREKILSSGITKGVIGSGSNGSCILDPTEDPSGDDFWVGFQFCLLAPDGTPIEKRTVIASANDLQSLEDRFPEIDRDSYGKFYDTLSRTSEIGDLDNATRGSYKHRGFLILDSPLSTIPSADSRFELRSELEAPVLAVRRALGIPLNRPLPRLDVRLGTTRGTNALLTRRGAPVGLVVSKGFRDLLRIGSQERPELFELNVVKPQPLTELVVEVDERVTATGEVLLGVCTDEVREKLRELKVTGAESLAICLLHAYRHDEHERIVESIAREVGFQQISRSSEVAPLIKLLSRAETTVLDAYLNPLLADYIHTIWTQFGGPNRTTLRLMTSGGQLVRGTEFRGRDSVLSGPAGGVVALASLGEGLAHHGLCSAGVIGLDMGGTSTDVSRYEGYVVRQFEGRKAGVRIMTPMMAIHTVAAGGGSLCTVEDGRLFVGPQSAGSLPGPACYGRGGPLTVTDLNLVLGRIVPEDFPFALDTKAVNERLEALLTQFDHATTPFANPLDLAAGFWQIAIHHMAEAVRTITTGEGADPRPMGLVSFGGAAGQHACAIAESLGMETVIDHPDASIFSALGMGLAPVGRFASHGFYRTLDSIPREEIDSVLQTLVTQTREALAEEFPDKKALPTVDIRYRTTAELRTLGTETALQVPLTNLAELADSFAAEHLRSFGYPAPSRPIELVTIRVDAELLSSESLTPVLSNKCLEVSPQAWRKIYHQGKWIQSGYYRRAELVPGTKLCGPAIIAGDSSTFVLDPGWNAKVCLDGTLVANHDTATESPAPLPRTTSNETLVDTSKSTDGIQAPTPDPVLLEVIGHRLEGIAQQMGEILRRTSISVNVKERLDYSCAIFNREGWLVAGAMHVPVHLGAMGHTVRQIAKSFPVMYPGDCYVSNDPYGGGSHLPDVTLVTPVFIRDTEGAPDYFVSSRAHHAEIGGMTPGSMPPGARRLDEEGVLIQDFALVRNGKDHFETLYEILTQTRYPSRSPQENIADLRAQVAAGRRGTEDLIAFAQQLGVDLLDHYMESLLEIAADAVQPLIAILSNHHHRFTDILIDDAQISVDVFVEHTKVIVDFEGTSSVHPLGWNATPAIVSAAVLYVLRCMAFHPLPLSEGVLRRVELRIPEGLLNPRPAADRGLSPAVVAGNVETSQRIVDCLLGALQLAAASQGTMNNLLIGDKSFGYYETICGGTGATASGPGADGVHSHMTNTRITDPEILESRYPLRLWEFSIRRGSGGAGLHRGGDGIVREIEFLRPLTVSMLTSRRHPPGPFGLAGGTHGFCGSQHYGRPIETDTPPSSPKHYRWETLPSSCRIEVDAGDRLRIETPGGGGYGMINTTDRDSDSL